LNLKIAVALDREVEVLTITGSDDVCATARFGGRKVQAPDASAVAVPRIDAPSVNSKVWFGLARPVRVASDVTVSVVETPVSWARWLAGCGAAVSSVKLSEAVSA
jgi:hypothetical protein